MEGVTLNTQSLPGLHWDSHGLAHFSGDLAMLYQRIDRLFSNWALELDVPESVVSPLIPATVLDRLQFFEHFSHTASLVSDAPAEGKNALDANGVLHQQTPAQSQYLLTPTACCQVFPMFENVNLENRVVCTTKSPCFRQANAYSPFLKQWCFTAREYVVIGTADEVREFINDVIDKMRNFLYDIDLPVTWALPIEPSFHPEAKLFRGGELAESGSKELLYGSSVSIASVNFHHTFPCEVFKIQRERAPAFSGCLSLGIERWMLAILNHFGATPARWPALPY